MEEDRGESYQMKKFLFTTFTALFAWMALADVTVTNLAVAQRPGTKLMDITYDVSSTTTNHVWVTLTVNNGAAAVNATNLTGSVGESVPIGTGRAMVWNMGTDWNTNAATLTFSVWAYDGVPACPVAKTGQTTSYREGDDGDLEPGVAWPTPRFTDLGDGTVKDNLTGLEWVQAPHSLSENAGRTNWDSAVDFCNNLVYAGHSDWRLPSVKELESLVNYGNYNLALPAGHPFTDVQGGYWSGTSDASATEGIWTNLAWFVSMFDGYVECYFKKDALGIFFCVWPVRGGQVDTPATVPNTGQTTSYRTGDDGDLETGVAWPDPRFTDLTAGTVKDNLTGLEWVQAPHSLSGNAGSTNWDSAIDFCNNLAYAGHSDWRLPSRKELMSLVDYGRGYPALPTGHPFAGVHSGLEDSYYWSGTSYAAESADHAWFVAMYYGGVLYYYSKIDYCYVWPVRGGQ